MCLLFKKLLWIKPLPALLASLLGNSSSLAASLKIQFPANAPRKAGTVIFATHMGGLAEVPASQLQLEPVIAFAAMNGKMILPWSQSLFSSAFQVNK